jgi:hypothetical protein
MIIIIDNTMVVGVGRTIVTNLIIEGTAVMSGGIAV